MDEELDVTTAEETAAESSTEEQTPETEQEGSEKEEGKVPVSRLKKETAKRKEAEERAKAAQELFQAYVDMEKESSPTPSGEEKGQAEFNTREDWIKFIKDQSKTEAEAAAKDAEARTRESIRREAERRELEKMEDFPILKDQMVEEVKRNPSLSPLDAYHLAKAKNPALIEKQIEQEVSQDMEAKQKAQVGKTTTRKEIPKVDESLVFEKDEKGNFKTPLKDLKEMLKRK